MITAIDLNKRRDQTRRMLASLLGERCYLHFSSELGLKCHGDLGGMTSASLSAVVRDALPNEYSGPMPAIVIVDDRLRRFEAMEAATTFDAFVLHEAGHILADGVTAASCPEVDCENIPEMVGDDWRTWPEHCGGHPWTGHDHRFIRALLHLHHRMESRGHVVYLPAAFQSAVYGLSPIENYRDALGMECQQNDWRPIQEALSGRVPAAFDRLWADDVVRSVRVPSLKGARK